MTKERFKFLQDNKQRGDITEVVRILNPKNNPKGVTYSEANSIIHGTLKGKWFDAVTNTLENIITKRQRRIKREQKKYSTVA